MNKEGVKRMQAIIVSGSAEEITALVVGLQERRGKVGIDAKAVAQAFCDTEQEAQENRCRPLDTMRQAVRQAIDDTEPKKPLSP